MNKFFWFLLGHFICIVFVYMYFSFPEMLDFFLSLKAVSLWFKNVLKFILSRWLWYSKAICYAEWNRLQKYHSYSFVCLLCVIFSVIILDEEQLCIVLLVSCSHFPGVCVCVCLYGMWLFSSQLSQSGNRVPYTENTLCTLYLYHWLLLFLVIMTKGFFSYKSSEYLCACI